MIPLLVYTLATVDAAFVGYRDAAGRNPHIHKTRYYARALLRGVIAGQLAIALAIGVIAACVVASPDPDGTWAALVGAGRVMLWVYGPYATLVLLAFAPYLSWSSDVRTLTSVVVFGPMTLIRPYVIVAGAVAAAVSDPRPVVIGCAVVAAAVMLGLPRAVDRWRWAVRDRHRPRG